MKVPYNKPTQTGRELSFMEDFFVHGDQEAYTKKCLDYFHSYFDFPYSLLVHSCTGGLELGATLLDIGPGDEVIIPSFTFVSTANAFALRGAKIIFADSSPDNPNLDPDHVESLITSKTKAIALVHYAGVSCDMDRFLAMAKKYGVHLVEDAAQAIDSYYKGRRLGSFGSFSAFSFHETKNIIAGEGGLFVAQNASLLKKAQEYHELYAMPGFLAAILYGQLEQVNKIQAKRKKVWHLYHQGLEALEDEGLVRRPQIPDYATINGHIYYILLENEEIRNRLQSYLKKAGIGAVFHYLPLHSSSYFKQKYEGADLNHCDRYSATLLRLPLFYSIEEDQVRFVVEKVHSYFR